MHLISPQASRPSLLITARRWYHIRDPEAIAVAPHRRDAASSTEEAGKVPEAPSGPATLNQGQQSALLTLAIPCCCAAEPLSMIHILWHNSDALENLQMARCCQWSLWPVHPWQDGVWMDSPVFETKRAHYAWDHRAREWNGDTRRWCNSCGQHLASFLSTPSLK